MRCVKFGHYFIKHLCTHLEKESNKLTHSLRKSSQHTCKLGIGDPVLGQKETRFPVWSVTFLQYL